MKKVIIYIHGFNSGPGEKAVELTKQFPNCEVVALQLPYNPQEAIEILKGIVDQHLNADVHIVGTSLGAFYAMCLSVIYSERININYYLLNTSFEPHITLTRYNGKAISNYKTGERFETTPEFFNSLQRLYDTLTGYYSPNCIYSSNYFIGTEDEVVDFTNFTTFIKSFKVPYKLHYSKQDHRFSDLSDVVKAIRYNSLLFI